MTAIYESAKIAKKYNIPIIADGGIKYSGDLTKAVAAGADVIMIGSLFAGCEESPGEFELYQGRRFRLYPRHGSDWRNERGQQRPLFPAGCENSYRKASRDVSNIQVFCPDTVYQLLGGLRSGIWATVERKRFRS